MLWIVAAHIKYVCTLYEYTNKIKNSKTFLSVNNKLNTCVEGETEISGNVELGISDELKIRKNYSMSFQFRDCLREPVAPYSTPGIIISVLICYVIIGLGVVCMQPITVLMCTLYTVHQCCP